MKNVPKRRYYRLFGTTFTQHPSETVSRHVDTDVIVAHPCRRRRLKVALGDWNARMARIGFIDDRERREGVWEAPLPKRKREGGREGEAGVVVQWYLVGGGARCNFGQVRRMWRKTRMAGLCRRPPPFL